MASKFPEEREEMGQLRTRKGHDMTWSCDKHAEPIKFYCVDHTIPICHPCATKDHVKKQCELQDIEDVILETRNKLEDTQTKIAAAKERFQTFDIKIKSKEASASNHLQSVNDEINATYDGKLKSVKDKERDEIRLINEEADEKIQFINEKRERRIKDCKDEADEEIRIINEKRETRIKDCKDKADEGIRIINEKRETRIKACKEEAEKQQQICQDIQAKLLSEIKKINVTVRKMIEDLKSKNQHEINIIDNEDSKIERIKQNDKTLVNEAPQVIASLDESLSWNVHQEVADYLDRIEREVQRVKFVEGKVGGKHYGRIDGYIGKWELVKSIDIPSIVNTPSVHGLISDDEMLDSDNALYVTNISTEHTEKVIAGEPDMWVTSCAPVDSDVIVCGKWRVICTGDSLDGYITLYDRQWKVIRDITIPKNTSSLFSMSFSFSMFNGVYVDVDMDGMILAAQTLQSNIHVINPADGKIVNTITMKGKKVYDEIQALSSGDIVVKTDDGKFTVISRSGEEKAVINCDEWMYSWCYVDKLTDTLYITYKDGERKVSAVDQVSRDGNIQARRIVEYKYSDRYPYRSPCLVTPSGNRVVCDGDKLLVYRKSFIL